MADDGDRILTLFGIGLVIAILAALGVLVLGAMSAPSPDAPAGGPDADWRLERLNETHVRVEHAGGEPVPAEHLVVTVDGRPRHPGWSGTLVEGDGGVLLVREGQVVRLFWTGTPGDRDLLEQWSSP